MREKISQYEEIKRGNDFGIFPLQTDTEESYLQKIKLHNVNNCLNSESSTVLQEFYGADPYWVTVSFQNKDLRFWEAGCTWIEDGKAEVVLQSVFEKKESLFSLYKKSEVIAHECVHVMRAALSSEKFEECFAYLLAPEFSKSIFSKIRTFFGPMFASTKEVGIALGCLAFSWLVFLTNTFFENSFLTSLSLVSYTGILLIFFFLLFRNKKRWNTFYGCARVLQEIGLQHPYHLMIRLLDEEIERFSRSNRIETISWIEKERLVSFRWNFLANRYIDQN